MDRTTRWETEALRDSGRPLPSSPKPEQTPKRTATNWATLKEAEAATGVPVNTLRKWARKSAIPSYLESDGDLALRMVDLDAVRKRARELGQEAPDAERTHQAAPTAPAQPPPPPSAAWEPSALEQTPAPPSNDDEPATMMVPVDAWNKMLAQLGNLHEAGQQLADARERAAKAETEAEFLRRRLAELRDESDSTGTEGTASGGDAVRQDDGPEHPPAGQPSTTEPSEASEVRPSSAHTTTYWRYLTTGWRGRRRRGTD